MRYVTAMGMRRSGAVSSARGRPVVTRRLNGACLCQRRVDEYASGQLSSERRGAKIGIRCILFLVR
jgi:hypothetical protein